MSGSEFITLDPEFEEILRKVASDPGSALLRVPRPQRIRGLFERVEPATALSTSWTKYERHLVQVYRAEMADLLRQACRIKLFDASRSRWHSSPRRTPDQRRAEPSELAKDVARSAVEPLESEEFRNARALLEQCVTDFRGLEPSVADLAEASLRLEARDEARVMAALDYAQRDMPRAAIQILERVIAELPRSEILMCAWNNLGMAWSMLQETGKAFESHVEGCSIVADRAELWMNRLLFGIQLGLAEDVRRSARTLDDLISEDDPLIEWYAADRAEQRRNGVWTPSRESLEMRIGSMLGPGSASRRIADVFE